MLLDVIYDQLCKHNLISPHQLGFRTGESTINQLLVITHKIYKTFDERPRKETCASLLDISKAFDTVWHEGLIHKLEVCGLRGKILKMLIDFLSDRGQRVVLNGQCSNWDKISAGVPQGSVIGTLFFLIYINDITHNIACNIKLLADDTSLFSIVRDENVAALDLRQDLGKITLWAWQRKMNLILLKPKKFYFHAKEKNLCTPFLC